MAAGTAPHLVELDAQPVAEELAVGEAGEGIVEGVVQELLLAALARRDVRERARHAQRAACSVAHRQTARLHPEVLTVAAAQTMLVLEMRRLGLDVEIEPAAQVGQVLVMDTLEPGLDRPLEGFFAQNLRPAWREIGLAARAVPVPDTVLGAGDR